VLRCSVFQRSGLASREFVSDVTAWIVGCVCVGVVRVSDGYWVGGNSSCMYHMVLTDIQH
jgi:hypothetical protein